MWLTDTEEQTAAFIVKRSSSSAGPFVAVGDTVVATGAEAGAVYSFFDATGSSSSYYTLDEVEVTGGGGRCASVIAVDESAGNIPLTGWLAESGQNNRYLAASSGGTSDAMIICPDAWVATLTPLKNHWDQFRQHSTLLVPLSTAGSTKEAIRSFVLSHSGLRYLLLVGDSTNRIELDHTIPTWSVAPARFIPSDAPYADRDGDGLPDIAVGRWPAHTATEAGVCVAKSLAYDFQSPNQAYRRKWLGLTSDIDRYYHGLVSGDAVRDHGNEFAALTPAQATCTQYRASEVACCSDARADLTIAAVNAGAHVVWVVSTSAAAWNMEFLNNYKITGLCPPPSNRTRVSRLDMTRFEPSNASGFWFPLSCQLGHFGAEYRVRVDDCAAPDSWVPSLAEDMLLAPNKGALTWFAPSGGSYPEENYIVGKAILERMTIGNAVPVGQMCMDAIRTLAVARPGATMRAASYVFLGDPTIVMDWRDSPTSVGESASSGGLRVSETISSQGFDLEFALAQREHVILTAYDVAGRRVRTIAQGLLEPGVTRLTWDGRNDSGRRIASGVYFVQFRGEAVEKTVRVVVLR